MDDIDKDIFDEYSAQIQTFVTHLMNNKTIPDDYRVLYLMQVGAELFKVGYGLEIKTHPKHFKTHGITLIPLEFKAEIEIALKEIQDKHLKKALDDSVNRASSDDEIKRIYKAFNKAINFKGVNTDIKTYS